ncbi:prolyl oligopeptidase family serine peptidase [Nocardiopsis sp. N85]|uniref:prolyl oligopeptidase family serine peptidase n=1 Tax=Nocardiopsis sp. N85 TaxID=3029400 RepID=UPI00237EF5D7|nr:prolyl oligopeptidase family serine peptidase [Nocardiopsis sp. N85]MDE3723631.1 prolyl oligopeptidase family serine peptidase [Nocardiopsis sp. N85]
MRNRAPGVALVHESSSVVDTLHGRPVPDPYRWLESADSPETLRWLEERAHDHAREAATWPLRDRLAERIRGYVATDLWSTPVHRPGLVMATVRPAGAEHPRLVAFDSPAADGVRADRARVVHDPVAADPSGRTTLDAWEPDPDGRLVAVQSSTGGVERGVLRVLRVGDGRPVGPEVRGVRYSHVAWAPQGPPAFYYVRRDDGDGSRGVWLRRVADGTETFVRACSGPGTVPGVRVLGGRLLLFTESHGTGHRTDLWLADLGEGPLERPVFRPVQVDVEAETEAALGPDGLLYLRTTVDAPWRRICAVDPADPGPAGWREVVPQEAGATLDAFTPCGTADAPELLVVRTRLGIDTATVHDARTGAPLRDLDLPGEGMVSGPVAAPDGTVHLGYADVTAQQRILCLAPGSARPLPWPPGGAAPPEAPEVERTVLWCRSADGTRVPVTVLTAHGTASDTPVPTLLHAYGGFGRPRRFGFSATVLAWLASGGRYAVAHVRGGGDAGREWHLAGAGRRKPRAVEDLIAAADALVATDLCVRSGLCLSGGSAGGLLVLAAAAARPDLCEAVIASAPLADMARFERLGLGRMWTREFGTVADPDDFAALMSYSPYHRVLESAVRTPGPRFPSVLLTGFDGDTRTDAAHPRKMCAALLAAARAEEGRPPALLRYERDVGHGPRSVGRAVGLAADAHAFAAHRTGLAPRRPARGRSWS